MERGGSGRCRRQVRASPGNTRMFSTNKVPVQVGSNGDCRPATPFESTHGERDLTLSDTSCCYVPTTKFAWASGGLLSRRSRKCLSQLEDSIFLVHYSDARALKALKFSPRPPVLDHLQQSTNADPVQCTSRAMRWARRLPILTDISPPLP
ncbi:hypothetical protein BKA93DRAFT_345493 [Sparassis latifolia]